MKKNKFFSILHFILAILWLVNALISANNSKILTCIISIALTIKCFSLGISYWRGPKVVSTDS